MTHKPQPADTMDSTNQTKTKKIITNNLKMTTQVSKILKTITTKLTKAAGSLNLSTAFKNIPLKILKYQENNSKEGNLQPQKLPKLKPKK